MYDTRWVPVNFVLCLLGLEVRKVCCNSSLTPKVDLHDMPPGIAPHHLLSTSFLVKMESKRLFSIFTHTILLLLSALHTSYKSCSRTTPQPVLAMAHPLTDCTISLACSKVISYQKWPYLPPFAHSHTL